MCAINGIAGGKGKDDEALISAMNSATAHRGPDGSRALFDEGATLGFNRLAIIDLSERAMQPMTDALSRYTIVFNGEIYNYKELKAQLSEYPFKTESDTEVILAAYSRWGDAAFARLNGMFALAVWDKTEKRLILARDAVGVKPLYYYFENGRLVFSSEIKAILEAGIPRTLNHEAFGHYLRLMYVPQAMTMFEGIRKLPPAHTLSYHDGEIDIRPFKGAWPPAPAVDSYEEAREEVRRTVEGAVQRQLVSDRPVGLYLSGGIDSSVILASASKTHPAINTYSVGFELGEGEEPEKFNADSELAKRTAQHFGATHHEFLLSSNDVLGLFNQAVRYLDEPVGNATALSQLFLAQKVKPTATVVLTGDGGDELFGGYERYRLSLVAEQFGWLMPFSQKAQLKGIERFSQLMFQKDAELLRILGNYKLPDTKALFKEDFAGVAHTTDVLMRVDEKNWLVDEALVRGDKMSMAASVEARVPLLDLEVRALLHSLPLSHKVTPLSTKKILKDAFAAALPQEVLSAPKRGWFSPGAKWLRHPNFVKFADEAFSESYAPAISPLLNLKGIRTMWEAHREKREYHYTILFALLVFLEWAREYKVSL